MVTYLNGHLVLQGKVPLGTSHFKHVLRLLARKRLGYLSGCVSNIRFHIHVHVHVHIQIQIQNPYIRIQYPCPYPLSISISSIHIHVHISMSNLLGAQEAVPVLVAVAEDGHHLGDSENTVRGWGDSNNNNNKNNNNNNNDDNTVRGYCLDIPRFAESLNS